MSANACASLNKLKHGKVFAFIDAAPDLIETIPVVEDDPVPYYSDFQQKSFYRSQSLIASLVKVNTLISMEKLTSIDASKGVYEIIFNDTKETDDETKACKICMTNESNCLIIPCCHKVACSDCIKQLPVQKCPVCRSPFQRVLPIYQT